MQHKETVYLRGPRRLILDFIWLVRLGRDVMHHGSRSERLRMLYYVASRLFVISAITMFCIFATLGLESPILSGTLRILFPLFFIYADLLDITRRIRPLNTGALVEGNVEAMSWSSGSFAIDVRSRGAIFTCIIPLVFGMHRVSTGDKVVIAKHPHDAKIAAIVNATPRAIMTDDRRRVCAGYVSKNGS